MSLLKVISGGQTGVDRAALDAALACGIPIGGFVPKGRKCEDGKVPAHYPMIEMPTVDYPARTRMNAEHSNGTLILMPHETDPSGGTLLTIGICNRLKIPVMVVDVKTNAFPHVANWFEKHDIEVLNVAGPRESKCPGIYKAAYEFLVQVFGDKTK